MSDAESRLSARIADLSAGTEDIGQEFTTVGIGSTADVTHRVGVVDLEESVRMLNDYECQPAGRVRLHPDKTRIVYCKDDKRRGIFGCTSLAFRWLHLAATGWRETGGDGSGP
jgi:hypothetical protein